MGSDIKTAGIWEILRESWLNYEDENPDSRCSLMNEMGKIKNENGLALG